MVKYETALDVFVTLFEYQNSEVIDLFVQYFTSFFKIVVFFASMWTFLFTTI